MTPENKNIYSLIPYQHQNNLSEEQMKNASSQFYQWCNSRRTVRNFSNKHISKQIIENIILTAGTAPSGANKQPWTFVGVQDQEIKKKIRIAAEEEEFKSYNQRMNDEWLKDLEPLGTNWHKPFLEIAPWLIVVFRQTHSINNNVRHNHYYVQESIGIASGLLLAAIHNAGLVALTHTPSPMNFLCSILNRPNNEKPFLLIPVGYPAENTMIPNNKRKTLEEISAFI